MRALGKAVVLGVLAILAAAGCSMAALSPETHEKRGLAYLEAGDFPKAEEELKLAASLYARETGTRAGHMGRVQYELGKVFRKQKKDEDAEIYYQRSLVIFSDNPKLISDADKQHWAACLRDYAEILRASGRAPEADIRERQARDVLGQGEATQPATTTPAAPPSEKAAQPPSPPATPQQPPELPTKLEPGKSDAAPHM